MLVLFLLLLLLWLLSFLLLSFSYHFFFPVSFACWILLPKDDLMDCCCHFLIPFFHLSQLACGVLRLTTLWTKHLLVRNKRCVFLGLVKIVYFFIFCCWRRIDNANDNPAPDLFVQGLWVVGSEEPRPRRRK